MDEGGSKEEREAAKNACTTLNAFIKAIEQCNRLGVVCRLHTSDDKEIVIDSRLTISFRKTIQIFPG